MLTPLLLLAATAHAQDLTYQWPTSPDEVAHYRIQTYVYAPRVLRFYASENLDARVAEFTMGLLVKCRQTGEEGKNVYVDCDIHRAQLGGMAADGSEQQKLVQIFQEYVNVLDDATIQMTFSPTGQIKTVDLEGVDKGTSREADVHDDLRMLVMRGLMALEVELPRDGVDPDKAWKQKGSPRVMQLPTRYGTAGAVRMKHTVVGRDGALVQIETEAEGTVVPFTATSSTDETTLSSSGSNSTVSMISAGKSTFDTEKHLLTRSEITVQGQLTASSSGVGDGIYLNQFVLAEWLENFDQLDAEYEAMIAGGLEPEAPTQETEAARAAEEAARKAMEAAPPPADAPEPASPQ